MALYDELIAQLKTRNPLPPLFPSQIWRGDLSEQVARSDDKELFGIASTVNAGSALNACRAGLLLWNDDLDASHTVAQNLEDATGSYWHAIIHRREGDAFNSNYWWRRTGSHPAFKEVHKNVLELLNGENDSDARGFASMLKRAGQWQPSAFVERCEAARRSDTDEWLRRVQVMEMQTLLAWCRNESG